MNLPTDLFILQDNAKLVDACHMHKEGVRGGSSGSAKRARVCCVVTNRNSVMFAAAHEAGGSIRQSTHCPLQFCSWQHLLKAPRNPYGKSVAILTICSLPCRQQRVRRRIVGHPPSFPVSHQPSQVARVEASRLLSYIYIYILYHFISSSFKRASAEEYLHNNCEKATLLLHRAGILVREHTNRLIDLNSSRLISS